MDNLQSYHPTVFQELSPVLKYLKNSLFPKLTEMETTFCHGDYHPLNILWDEKKIMAVIDWEFTGYKPFLYDAANMLGCLGMEHPETLLSPISLDIACSICPPLKEQFKPKSIVIGGKVWVLETN